MRKAILLIDHGSRLDEANQMLTQIAVLLQTQDPSLMVHIAHMELAEPDIAAGIQACVDDGATHIVAHPYMLAPGRHAVQDIPTMVKAAAKQHPHVQVHVSEPLGAHPLMAQVILDRCTPLLSADT
tara:strand:- start:151 stop:528 length:378 start_codon:yes stop_codon:yes gene_type:complete